MIVVLPFWRDDAWLLEKNLLWMQELDGKLDYDCILSYDTQADPTRIQDLASQIFRSVRHCKYKRLKETYWPVPQNHAFASTAYFMAGLKQSWLWVETDSVPMRKGWLTDIAKEHEVGKKPFTGHWNEISKVFNGVAVYPPDVSRYSSRAMLATLTFDKDRKQPPWDVYCSAQVEPHLRKANHLFQHIWNNPATNAAWTFPDNKTVKAVVREGIALFHRNKDGTLIDRLRDANPKPHPAYESLEYNEHKLIPKNPPKVNTVPSEAAKEFEKSGSEKKSLKGYSKDLLKSGWVPPWARHN